VKLREIRSVYGDIAARQKLAVLERYARTPPRTAGEALRLHDDLLFLRAFPDDARVLAAVRRALGSFDRIVARLSVLRSRAADSGMTGTVTHLECAYPVALWLATSFPSDADIDWANVDDEGAIDGLIRTVLQPAEADAFDGGELSTREWLALAKGARARSDLAWILGVRRQAGMTPRTFALMFEAAKIPVRWRLKHSAGSTTHNVLRTGGITYRTAMRRITGRAAALIITPTSAIELLSARRARQVIDVSRAALAARCREVHAVACANPHEVYLCDLGAGVSLAVIGAEPQHRLSLEANYGYTLFANGVPMGYGGVTPLYRQANTGINIFESFRGSEAAFVWVQMLRAFRSLFHVRRVVVNAYQFGEGNSEAITTGAFWFYYRLGFRPARAATRVLAAREFKRFLKRRQPTPAATLRALADGDLHLDLPGYRRAQFFDEQWLNDLSVGATKRIAQCGGPDRGAAARAIADEIARTLGGTTPKKWPREERDAFDRLAPVCALIPGIERWPGAARTELVSLLRAKGHPQERNFVLAAQAHRRFFPALIRACLGQAEDGGWATA
jgi:hypothetical protein